MEEIFRRSAVCRAEARFLTQMPQSRRLPSERSHFDKKGLAVDCRESLRNHVPETGLEPARAWVAHQPLKLVAGYWVGSGFVLVTYCNPISGRSLRLSRVVSVLVWGGIGMAHNVSGMCQDTPGQA